MVRYTSVVRLSYQACFGWGVFFLDVGETKSASKCLKAPETSPISVGEKFRQVPVSVMTTTGMNLGLGGVDWILRLFFFFWNWVEINIYWVPSRIFV